MTMPALVIVRRLVFLLLLMFWQGGFTFYAAIVVPIGTELLGSLHQGMITRQVTQSLNVSGAIALAVWAWELAAEPAPTLLRQRLRWLLWLLLATLLAALALLHPRMDALLDVENVSVLDHAAFHHLHRWYLWLGTAQWAGSIVLIFATLRSWRDSDRQPVAIAAQGPAGKTT